MEQSLAVPVLRTARLLLRGPRVEDAQAHAALWADPVVTRYIGGVPVAAPESWLRLLRNAGHWALLGFGCWLIEDAASGQLIGEAGFLDLRRDTEPSFAGTLEIGWVVAPAAHGRGLATEAVRAMLAWGAGHFGPARVVCMIDPANAASLRLAQAQGFSDAGMVTLREQPMSLLARTL